MKYLYILVNCLTLLGPLALSFDQKVAFHKNWKYLFPSIAFMMLFFIPWDVLFTMIGVWGFNPNFTSGITLFNLPLGEILFFITVPYACVFVYECLNAYFPERFLIKKPSYIIVGLMLFSVLIYFLFSDKLYTAYTALFAIVVLLVQLLGIRKYPFLGNFYRAYFICFIPMLLIDGVLTGKPIVIYNQFERTFFRVGPIPWEDFLYQFIMLYMVIGCYEFLKRRAIKKATSSVASS